VAGRAIPAPPMVDWPMHHSASRTHVPVVSVLSRLKGGQGPTHRATHVYSPTRGLVSLAAVGCLASQVVGCSRVREGACISRFVLRMGWPSIAALSANSGGYCEGYALPFGSRSGWAMSAPALRDSRERRAYPLADPPTHKAFLTEHGPALHARHAPSPRPATTQSSGARDDAGHHLQWTEGVTFNRSL
jgi:hypothetical protein